MSARRNLFQRPNRRWRRRFGRSSTLSGLWSTNRFTRARFVRSDRVRASIVRSDRVRALHRRTRRSGAPPVADNSHITALRPCYRVAHTYPGRMTIKALSFGCMLLGCALALAACGSSGGSHAGGSRDYGSFLKFADCMRAHGVPNFPDPSAGGGGVHIGPAAGLNPDSPAFQAGLAVCKKQLPGGGPKATELTESQKLQALKFARCMRAHGITNFPDPDSASGPPQADVNIDSPAVQRAFRACRGGPNGHL